MKNIKGKMILYFSLLVIIANLIVGTASIIMYRNSFKEEGRNALDSVEDRDVKTTLSRIEGKQNVLQILACLDSITSMDWNQQQPVLQKALKGSDYLDLAIVSLNGIATYTNGSQANLSDRGYIQTALKGQTAMSDLLISKVTNSPVFMYATPIKNGDKIVGALIGRRDGEALSRIVDDGGYGKKGHAFIINTEGKIVAHKNRSLVLKEINPINEVKNDSTYTSLANLEKKMIAKNSGVIEYTDNSNKYIAAYDKIKGTNWIYVSTASEDEVLSSLPKLTEVIVITSIIGLALSIVVVYIIGNMISKPISKVTDIVKNVADLDISKDIDEELIKRKDETGRLAKALQEIVNNIRSIIKEISTSSESVTSTSEELTATAEQVSLAAEQVAKNVEEIAFGSTKQAQSTEEGYKGVELLGIEISNNKEFLDKLNDTSNDASKTVNEGLDEINKLTKITEESYKITNEINQVIIKTNESSSNIGKVSDMIADVAEQTGLLSLNAAIEAARAGEAGKGFAIVAEEIRNLSEQSEKSTKSIDSMVKELKTSANDAVKLMERINEIALEQRNSTLNCKMKYELTLNSLEQVKKAIEMMNVSGNEMEKTKEDILRKLQALSNIAETNAASTEEVSASVEEQTASMKEMANASEGLSVLASELYSIINRFKI